MRRRDFIAALGGAAAMPLAAQERVRRVGVLLAAYTEKQGAKNELKPANLYQPTFVDLPEVMVNLQAGTPGRSSYLKAPGSSLRREACRAGQARRASWTRFSVCSPP